MQKEVWDRIQGSIPTAFRWFPGAEVLIGVLIQAVIKVLLPLLKTDEFNGVTFGVTIPDSLLDAAASMVLQYLKIDPGQAALWNGIIKLAIQYVVDTIAGPKQHMAFATAQGSGDSLLAAVERLAAEIPGE